MVLWPTAWHDTLGDCTLHVAHVGNRAMSPVVHASDVFHAMLHLSPSSIVPTPSCIMLHACSGQDVVKYTEANKCVISGLRGLVEGSDAVGHYRLLVSSQCAWLKQPVELEHTFHVGAAAACKILVRLHDAVRAICVIACFYVCVRTFDGYSRQQETQV